MFDKFAKVVINKNNLIQQSSDSINHINVLIECIKKLTDINDMKSIINKEMNNTNTMIKYLNQIVDKIIKKETIIFNRKEQECEKKFEQQRKQEFEEKQNDINNMKYNYHSIVEVQKQQHIEKIKFQNDNELKQLNTSKKSSLEWSGKQNYIIIFDSKTDGDSKGILENKVFNKKNLYFISFDNQNNVFGGYMNKMINNKSSSIKDLNSFVFSLIRNGKVKNKKYNIKKKEENAFYLDSNHHYLYRFGHSGYDVIIPKICYSCEVSLKIIGYEYNGEQQPLRDGTEGFIMKRILVLKIS